MGCPPVTPRPIEVRLEGAGEELLHVLRDRTVWDVTDGDVGDTLTMYCGTTCVIADDTGTLSPAIDFYDLTGAHKSTCRGCRTALGLP
jgi:hypothetical protein